MLHAVNPTRPNPTQPIQSLRIPSKGRRGKDEGNAPDAVTCPLSYLTKMGRYVYVRNENANATPDPDSDPEARFRQPCGNVERAQAKRRVL